MTNLFIGIDVGTTGCRAAALDEKGQVVGQISKAMPPPSKDGEAVQQDPDIWWTVTKDALSGLLDRIDRAAVRAIAVDGTSGTLLLADDKGRALGPALMYNDARASAAAERIKPLAPDTSGAQGRTSALAKLLHLADHGTAAKAEYALHQADWIAAKLSGQFGISDHNNALKLGYDVVHDRWPDWLQTLDLPSRLFPTVLPPGTAIGPIMNDQAAAFGLSPETLIVSGTTDGVAAFLATGASAPGDAVTSLGSTLVVKQLADRPLFDAKSGVYSHRLGDLWLPGGASNSGGAALAQFFDAGEIERLTPFLAPAQATALDYYPLPSKGERFPINDPGKASVVAPRPDDDAVFLQGLLEGVAGIEALAYQRLEALGAPAVKKILTVGGGAANPAWTEIRRLRLGVEVAPAKITEAAFGTARLAMKGYQNA
jgi:sugar (pentulose or hexulose) kinase